MFDPIRSDKALQTSRIALEGLALRQDVASDNVVNVDTPGYHAQEVRFEDALKRYMEGDTSTEAHLFRTNERHLDINGQSVLVNAQERKDGTPRADGNNVDIDTELLQMTEVGVRHAALTQAVSRKLRLLKAIAMTQK